MAVDCLYLKTDDKNGYEISMDTAECIPGTHTPLESVASMVEFGDIGVPKYPIFSSTFKEIRKCYALFKDEYMGVY